MSIQNTVIANPPLGHARFSTPKQLQCPVGINVSGAAAAAWSFVPTFPIAILKLNAAITTAIVATETPPVVDIAVSGGDNTLASGAPVSIPNATAKGSVVKSDDVYIPVDAGEKVSVNLKTQAVGSAAGVVYPLLDYVDRYNP